MASTITLLLKGGLGNQMFQYAFGREMSQRTGLPLRLDWRSLNRRRHKKLETPRNLGLHHLNTEVTQASAAELREFGSRSFHLAPARLMGLVGRHDTGQIRSKALDPRSSIVRESSFGFSETILQQGFSGGYFEGYWQSPKYFAGVESHLRGEFTPKARMTNASREMLESIKSTRSICVNVRRGDYVHNPRMKAFHGVLSQQYYYDALQEIQMQVDSETIFVFSDEPEWCKANLLLSGNVTYVDHSHAGPEFTHYLALMAAAHAFVIPNSTFAWWAAWLSGVSGSRIAAPSAWFADPTVDTSDLVPVDWQRL